LRHKFLEFYRSIMGKIERDEFRDKLLEWYEKGGRSFYWRENKLTPFKVLVLEMLLKRTKAETVDNMAKEVLNKLSSPEKTLNKQEEEIKELIRPLGLYNRRSKNIRNVCRSLIENFDGEVPETRNDLLSVNGIGNYIADAILCFSFEKPVMVLDTNTAKVAKFYFNLKVPDDLRQDQKIKGLMEPLVPEDHPRKFNWALIDIGSEIKKTGMDPL